MNLKRIITSLLFSILLIGLNSEIKAQNEKNPDFNVAIDFINSYADTCNKSIGKKFDRDYWIENNSMISVNFKKSYKNLIEDALKVDPELGLGFDPIFDAQDYPNSFSIYDFDKSTGFLTVYGNDWKGFKIIMKIIYENDKWLVDGSGVINIPEDKRIKEN